MTRPHIALFTAALAIAGSACAVAGDDEQPAPLDTRTRLAEPVMFHIAPNETKANIQASFADDQVIADLVVTAGWLDVSVDDADRVVLDDLTIAFADMSLPKNIYPGDLVLTDVTLHLGAPLPCIYTYWFADDDAANCGATTELTLDWNVRIAGVTHPMASQTIPGVALDVELFPGHDRLVLEVDAEAKGDLWSYLDILRLANLSLWFRGYDHAPFIR